MERRKAQVEFTLKKKSKSIFELNDKSQKIFRPTLTDCYDDARTATERGIFNEQIKQVSKIVDRVMEGKGKVKRLKKERKRKNLLLDAKKFRALKRNQSEGGEARSLIYKNLYSLYRNSAEDLRGNGHLKTKKAIATHIVKNLPSEIEDYLTKHSLKRLSVNRISSII